MAENWIYTGGAFQATNHDLPEIDGTESWERSLEDGGYRSSTALNFGDHEAGLEVEVYTLSNGPAVRELDYDYCVALSLGLARIELVFCPELPDLISLLDRLVPLVKMSMDDAERKERWRKEVTGG